MSTFILTVPEKEEKWFKTLFNQFQVKHRLLSESDKADLVLAKLIDEAMAEDGEVDAEKVKQFIRKHAA
jgi:hypothetical protein